MQMLSGGIPPTYQVGRRIMLVFGALLCATRGIAYMPWATSPPYGQAVEILTWNGTLLWLWVVAWMGAAGLFIWDIFLKQSNKGIITLIGLMTAWSTGYLIAGIADTVATGQVSRVLVTFGTYLFPAGMIFGLLIMISRIRIATAPISKDPEV